MKKIIMIFSVFLLSLLGCENKLKSDKPVVVYQSSSMTFETSSSNLFKVIEDWSKENKCSIILKNDYEGLIQFEYKVPNDSISSFANLSQIDNKTNLYDMKSFLSIFIHQNNNLTKIDIQNDLKALRNDTHVIIKAQETKVDTIKLGSTGHLENMIFNYIKLKLGI